MASLHQSSIEHCSHHTLGLNIAWSFVHTVRKQHDLDKIHWRIFIGEIQRFTRSHSLTYIFKLKALVGSGFTLH